MIFRDFSTTVPGMLNRSMLFLEMKVILIRCDRIRRRAVEQNVQHQVIMSLPETLSPAAETTISIVISLFRSIGLDLLQ